MRGSSIAVISLFLLLAAAPDGTLYVADATAIRRISPGGTVSTLAGNSTRGDKDGLGSQARFAGLDRVVVDANSKFFVTDSGNQLIPRITLE